MPLFYFILKVGEEVIPDIDGEEFESEAAARMHARAVARELTRNREGRTENWRVQVCNDYLHPLYEVVSDVAERLDFGETTLLSRAAAVARTVAAINDAAGTIDGSLSELRKTIGQIDAIISSRPSH